MCIRDRPKRDLLPYIELLFGLYMAASAAVSLLNVHSLLCSPFLVIFAFGFFYVSLMSFQARRARRLARTPEAQPRPVRADA